MPGHAEATGAFAAALRGADPAPGLFAGPQDDIARRLAVYRNNVAVSLSDALSRRFPVVERLVGPAFFGPLARAFIATDLPQIHILQFTEGYGAAYNLSGYEVNLWGSRTWDVQNWQLQQ